MILSPPWGLVLRMEQTGQAGDKSVTGLLVQAPMKSVPPGRYAPQCCTGSGRQIERRTPRSHLDQSQTGPVQHQAKIFTNFSVEVWRGWLDVGAAEALVEHVPVEGGLELGPVVDLDRVDPEGQAFGDVVDEGDGSLLVAARVDPQHAQSGEVVDCAELVVLAQATVLVLARGQELHIDLDMVAGSCPVA